VRLSWTKFRGRISARTAPRPGRWR
jgi:hypothetical protein